MNTCTDTDMNGGYYHTCYRNAKQVEDRHELMHRRKNADADKQT